MSIFWGDSADTLQMVVELRDPVTSLHRKAELVCWLERTQEDDLRVRLAMKESLVFAAKEFCHTQDLQWECIVWAAI